MNMHVSVGDPRLSHRGADGLGIIAGGAPSADLKAYRTAGYQVTVALPQPRPGRAASSEIRRRASRLRLDLQAAMARPYASVEIRAWLTGNARMLASAESEARNFLQSARRYPAVVVGRTEHTRVSVIATAYLDTSAQAGFAEESFAAFLRGAQEGQALELGELRAARGALMLELLARVIAASTCEDQSRLSGAVNSISLIGRANWMQWFASVSPVDRVLQADPSGAYAAMDDSSRDHYRHVISYLARHGTASEREVAEAAVSLADAVADAHVGEVTAHASRRMHVGYYLVDQGLPALEVSIGFRAPLRRRAAAVLTSRPSGTYLGGVALVTVTVIVAILYGVGVPAPGWVALLLLLPALQAAVALVKSLVPALIGPRTLPKLDFSKVIPAAARARTGDRPRGAVSRQS